MRALCTHVLSAALFVLADVALAAQAGLRALHHEHKGCSTLGPWCPAVHALAAAVAKEARGTVFSLLLLACRIFGNPMLLLLLFVACWKFAQWVLGMWKG